MKKLKKYIIPLLMVIITFFLIYPKSGLIDLVWLIGSALAPGIQNSITGWFVFFSIIGVCYSVFYVFFKLQNIVISFFFPKYFSPKGGMKLDLDKLDKNIDLLFENETSKSLRDWLTNKRKK